MKKKQATDELVIQSKPRNQLPKCRVLKPVQSASDAMGGINTEWFADAVQDRFEADRLLASRLCQFADRNDVIVLACRGGVPVAFDVARALWIDDRRSDRDAMKCFHQFIVQE
jgi:hypothetical protein